MTQYKISHANKGFTLVEILVIVLIISMIAVAAVPVYKKNQDKNRYLAATGVLLELSNAARMVSVDYPTLAIGSKAVTQNASSTDEEPTSNNIIGWLQTNKYLNKIPFNNGTYMGYSFAISTQGTANCGASCTKTNAVACMNGSNLNSTYTCVWVDNSGNLRNN